MKYYLKARLTDKWWFFRIGYLAGISLKMNKMSLPLQGKQLTVFITNDQNTRFQAKLRILENLFLSP